MKLRAPVVPPLSVIEKLKQDGLPVRWQNGQDDYLMYYQTEYEGSEIVTRLLPGSAKPVEGWLQ